MTYTRFEYTTEFPVAVGRLWALHMRPDALSLLTPPALHLDVIDPGRGVEDGSVVDMRVGPSLLRRTWSALHTAFDPGHGFTDVALDGPFPFWEHRHEFETLGRGRSRLRDVVWYVLPRPLPRWLGPLVVNLALRWLFAWRHVRTRVLLCRPARPRRAVTASRAAVRPSPA